MAETYDHKAIEDRWQSFWEKEGAFSAKEAPGAQKYYVLEMFPYPSGKIHMGHVRNYSIGDVLARFLMMRGKKVLHPMGWDAFGLPAENAAIQRGIHPARWTYENIDNMRTQLKRMGFSYDWTREVCTSSPDYYRWNQWIFLKLYEKGLSYKRLSSVNWCPGCSTVLANEQVEDGLCWRCDSPVEVKELEQWFLKITAYAEELLDFTYKLPGWPEKVLIMQRNWIGKSVGAEVIFPVQGSEQGIRIFTTRPDTIYGVTFMSLAPKHPLVEKITRVERLEEVRGFVEEVERERASVSVEELEKAEKKGVFTGAYAINPLNGDRVPVYVANFVLMEYGTGAVMAVPAHDQRDFEFAKKYGLPVKAVINPPGQKLDPNTMTEAFTGEGEMTGSGEFTGMKSTDGAAAVTDFMESRGLGKKTVNFKLRDWGISRQRYWGCPIPVVYCKACGTVPVTYEDLPVILPEDVKITGKGLSPLQGAEGFVNTRCPRCGGPGRRETDTMDTFVDSSWYFLRYTSPGEEALPFNNDKVREWMPVDQYIGGVEHAVLHLLYARFFTKALRDLGLHPFDEPFTNLLTQGMVCKEVVRCPDHGFLFPEEVRDGRCVTCGKEVERGGIEKMSKSRKNIVDPDKIIEKYGADTTRLFSLFAAPPERDLEWSEEGVEGCYRFIGRVWRLVVEEMGLLRGTERYRREKDPPLGGLLKEVHARTHRTIKKVSEDIGERLHFNTAISSVMEHVNSLYALRASAEKGTEAGKKVLREGVEALLAVLSPFAPHMCEELWTKLGSPAPLYRTPWPSYDREAIEEEEVLVVVQVNGKVRARIRVPAGSMEEDVREAAMKDAKVIEWTREKRIQKVVYVPDKLLNIVAP